MLNDCNVYVVHMHQPTISQSHPMCIFLFVGEFHPFIHLKYYYFFLSTILPLALREEVIVSHSTWLYQGRTLIFAFTLQHEYSIWWMPSWSVWLFSPFSFHLCTKLMVTIWLFSFGWFCWSCPLVSTHRSWGSSTTSFPSLSSSMAMLHHQPHQWSQHQAQLRHKGKQGMPAADIAAYGGQWIWQQPSQSWPRWQKPCWELVGGKIRDRNQ